MFAGEAFGPEAIAARSVYVVLATDPGVIDVAGALEFRAKVATETLACAR